MRFCGAGKGKTPTLSCARAQLDRKIISSVTRRLLNSVIAPPRERRRNWRRGGRRVAARRVATSSGSKIIPSRAGPSLGIAQFLAATRRAVASADCHSAIVVPTTAGRKKTRLLPTSSVPVTSAFLRSSRAERARSQPHSRMRRSRAIFPISSRSRRVRRRSRECVTLVRRSVRGSEKWVFEVSGEKEIQGQCAWYSSYRGHISNSPSRLQPPRGENAKRDVREALFALLFRVNFVSRANACAET